MPNAFFFVLVETKAYIGMFLLHELKETRHVWSSEVINSFKSGEYGSLREALEVVLTNILKNIHFKRR